MKSDNWYTPKEIIEPIRDFYLGKIDLDVASCIDANEIIQANRYFDGERPIDRGGKGNGLQCDWFGDVWCNPPYLGRGTVEKWVSKAIDEYKGMNASQIVMLLNRSDANWYQEFLDDHMILGGGYYQFRDRIKFIDGDTGKKSSPRYNNDLIYWGRDPMQFMAMCYSAYGNPTPHSL